jgi:copper resistance protein C
MKSFSISLSMRALAAAVAFALAQSALAHAHPKHERPTAGEALGTAPTEASIEFDDALEPAFSSLHVADSTGNSVTSSKSSVDTHDKKHMTVALGPLKPGAYTVTWVAVAADGHRTQGHYTFTVK